MNSNNLQLKIFEELGDNLPVAGGVSSPTLSALSGLAYDFSASLPGQLRDADLPNWPAAADWQPQIAQFVHSAQGRHLRQFLRAELAIGTVIYPAEPFYALQHTPLSAVRVVILGQDPYHGPGQAHGLAFSVRPGVKIPPSLRNIFKEIARDNALRAGQAGAIEGSAVLGNAQLHSDGMGSTLQSGTAPVPLVSFLPPASGNLDRWAAQGVLLLNTCLTVQDGQPASHAKQGWEVLTDALIQACAQKAEPVVFMLWGAHAQAKQALIAAHNADGRHGVFTANHPSPLSALRPPTAFLGCGHFGRCNQWLLKNGQIPIAW